MEVPGRAIADDNPKEDHHLCNPCLNADEEQEADGFCQTCQEYLCNTCIQHHRRLRVTRHHVILDKDAMPKVRSESSQHDTVCTEPCKQHPDKFIEFYCCNHYVLGCSVCTIVNHRACDIEYIPDVAKTLKNSEEFRRFATSIEDIERTIEQYGNQLDVDLESVSASYEVTSHEIKTFRTRINEYLDKMESVLQERLESFRTRDRCQIEYLKSECEKFEDRVKNIKQKFEDNKKTLSKLYVFIKKEKESVARLASETTPYKDKMNTVRYTFNPNTVLQNAMSNETALGDVVESLKRITSQNAMSTVTVLEDDVETVELNSSLQIARHKEATLRDADEFFKTNSSLQNAPLTDVDELNAAEQNVIPLGMTAENVTDSTGSAETAACSSEMCNSLHLKITKDRLIDCKTSEDKETPLLTGLVLVSSNTLLVTDAPNHTLKLIDVHQNKVVSRLKLLGRPRDVTSLPNDQAAVTIRYEKKIQIVRTTDRLSHLRSFCVDGQCMGIEYINDALVVTYQKPGKVEIMDITGKVLHVLTMDSNCKLPLFDNPVCVLKGVTGKYVYVIDYAKNSVTKVSVDGNVLERFQDTKLSKPSGIFAIDDYRLILSNWKSGHLCVISDKNNKLRIIQQLSCVNRPRALVYQPKENQFIMSSEDKQQRQNLHVYTVSVL